MADDVLRVGGMRRLQITITNSAGTKLDPTTLSLEVKDPSRNIDTYTYAAAQITKNSTGVYYKDITFDESGSWDYEYQGTGAAIFVAANSIYVHPQKIS